MLISILDAAPTMLLYSRFELLRTGIGIPPKNVNFVTFRCKILKNDSHFPRAVTNFYLASGTEIVMTKSYCMLLIGQIVR